MTHPNSPTSVPTNGALACAPGLPLVVLFDIDGTLVTCHGAGRVAIEAAFQSVTQRADALRDVSFAGMTDRAIVRAGLSAVPDRPHQGAESEAMIDEILARYLAHLPQALGDTPPTVFDGARAMVDRLGERPRTAVGLGTGNLAAGARHKLAPVGLWGPFGFGGFGSDREARAELIEVGARRGCAQLGVTRAEATVAVIGDTPADVAAAHAIGAQCLAVATSRYSIEALRQAGATHVVATLTDPGARSAWA